MKKIIFISLDADVIDELKIMAAMNFDMEYELHCISALDTAETITASLNPDIVVLSYEALIAKESWNFNDIPVAFLARTKSELEDGYRYGFPTIGIANNPVKIVEILGKKPYRNKITQKKDVQDIIIQDNKRSIQTEKEDFLDTFTPITDLEEFYEEEQPLNAPEREISGNSLETLDDKPFEEYKVEKEYKEDIIIPDIKTNGLSDEDIPSGFSIPSKETSPPIKKSSQVKNSIREEFEKDTGRIPQKTKVITVYSAKGGVGKTTIAAELATYLSLVDVGRRRLRICIVDYNIDFGDVRSTIHMDVDKLNLTHWAAEVQELLDMGKHPDEIWYSKEDIENWLSIEKRSGLYVLPAPLTNEDSMGIESDSLEIILNNIVKYGDFDYVICDTGNNTRDSTMIALEHADTILLIMTQNVNTANCDKAFIETMKAIDFDLSHIKLVINNIMPQKSTGISVQEIVEFFPFDCIGKLKFNTDVIEAGNIGNPLAFKPGHDFTKQLRSIVSYILQENDFNSAASPVKKKKSLFGNLFKK